MARVLVPGGTGTLGRQLVPRLLAQGHDVRVLSRRTAPRIGNGAVGVQGDVLTGTGLPQAVDGVDVIVHAATGGRRVRATEVQGTRQLLDAARGSGAHVVYVSIVGVDRHRFAYYRYKYAAEQVVEASGVPWTIQRATQFHSLIETFLSRGFFVRTPNLAFQPVDSGEVADRLVHLVTDPPGGHAPDFGGPHVLGIRELARTRTEVTNRRTRLVRVPRLGFLRDFDAGAHLCPDHAEGTVTWAQWLARQASPLTG